MHAPGFYPNETRTPQASPLSPSLLAALSRRGLARALGLLALLASEAQAGVVSIPQPELARRLGVSERTVRRHERDLAAADVLHVRRGGPRNRRELTLVALEHHPANASELSTVVPEFSTFSVETGHRRPDTAGRSERRGDGALQGSRAQRIPSERSSAERPRDFSTASWGFPRPGPGSTRPNWPGPSRAVDDRAEVLHTRLGMWPNTLREVVLLARDVCTNEGEARTLQYLANLERHSLQRASGERRGALGLGALRNRAARGGPSTAKSARQLWLRELFGTTEVRP